MILNGGLRWLFRVNLRSTSSSAEVFGESSCADETPKIRFEIEAS